MMSNASKFYFAGGTSRDGTKGYWLNLMAENGVRQLTVFETKDHVIGEELSVKMEAAEEFVVLELEGKESLTINK